jgi:hypothetical protein
LRLRVFGKNFAKFKTKKMELPTSRYVSSDESDSDDDSIVVATPTTSIRKRTIEMCKTVGDVEQMEKELKRLKKEIKEKEEEERRIPECPICFLPCDNGTRLPIVASCKHIFCIKCFTKVTTTRISDFQNYHKCPLCRCYWNNPTKQLILPVGTSKGKCMEEFDKLI